MAEESIGRTSAKAAEVFQQVEDSLEPGPARDIWWALRSSLRDEGPSGVETYLDAEFKRRLQDLQEAIDQVDERLGGME